VLLGKARKPRGLVDRVLEALFRAYVAGHRSAGGDADAEVDLRDLEAQGAAQLPTTPQCVGGRIHAQHGGAEHAERRVAFERVDEARVTVVTERLADGQNRWAARACAMRSWSCRAPGGYTPFIRIEKA
jgi:hypothetical protein